MSSDQLEQLPASEYSPVEFYTLDWDEMQLAIRIAEIKLEFIKRDFARSYSLKVIGSQTEKTETTPNQ